jgi:hypothetical protein
MLIILRLVALLERKKKKKKTEIIIQTVTYYSKEQNIAQEEMTNRMANWLKLEGVHWCYVHEKNHDL